MMSMEASAKGGEYIFLVPSTATSYGSCHDFIWAMTLYIVLDAHISLPVKFLSLHSPDECSLSLPLFPVAFEVKILQLCPHKGHSVMTEWQNLLQQSGKTVITGKWRIKLIKSCTCSTTRVFIEKIKEV